MKIPPPSSHAGFTFPIRQLSIHQLCTVVMTLIRSLPLHLSLYSSLSLSLSPSPILAECKNHASSSRLSRCLSAAATPPSESGGGVCGLLASLHRRRQTTRLSAYPPMNIAQNEAHWISVLSSVPVSRPRNSQHYGTQAFALQ